MQKTNRNGRTERRDAAENRQRILDAANQLFAQYGVEPVSMNQIAAEAGIGAGTLYRRYRNKGELCMDLIKDSKLLLFNTIEEYMKTNAAQAPALRLRGLLAIFISFKENHAQLLAGIEGATSLSEARSMSSSPFYMELHELLVRLFDEMAADNEQSQPDSVFRTDMLMAALSSKSYLFQRNVRGRSPDLILDQLCRIYI
ncbi:TetR/AcrR family transcriptional regulator [Paenibacillus pedocola]|uniref:TetR/AcrR family transcriptional regulator n=1 Tax=Paenibacillus pedocola TaxID=3242193 RepID=UPI002877A385|nr:helix-turn-helix domain-containing protein [Paenibacillus typhae]